MSSNGRYQQSRREENALRAGDRGTGNDRQTAGGRQGAARGIGGDLRARRGAQEKMRGTAAAGGSTGGEDHPRQLRQADRQRTARRRLIAPVQVHQRLVIYVQGYDPRGLAEYYRMFRREFRRTCELYGLTGKVGGPQNDPKRFTTAWDVTTHGNGWQVETRYLFLRWEDIIRNEFARRGRRDWEERMEIFAGYVVDAVRDSDADEAIIVGHSSGSFLAVDVLDRALTRDPQLGSHGPRVRLLTVGANLPIIGFHPEANWFRNRLRRLAVAPDIDWVDYQSRHDIM